MTRPHKQEQEQASEEVVEVSPGILRMQLPIRMPGLGHVNCYAIPDAKGLAVVDPGLPGPSTWKAIEARMGSAGLNPKAVHTVVVTHSHPDHFGSAGRLAKHSGADLVTHESFDSWWGRKDGRMRTTPWGGQAFKPGVRRRIGMVLMRRSMGHIFVPPVPTKKVADGEGLVLGDRRFLGVHTPGHTKDHLCLLDPENGILLSGDHVLPTITPHISGAFGSDDPLDDFRASLEKVAALDVSRVLPAHGHPFDDLKGRTTAIWEHHLERLERLLEGSRAQGEATVETLSHELFREKHWGFMAESETYAHLEHLRIQGKVERIDPANGISLYRAS